MDLSQNSSGPSSCWFPRPRGDGPCPCPLVDVTVGVSPPTRGWTPDDQSRSPRRRGFPAHAGMDPLEDVRVIMVTGFPRPRGDGPHSNLTVAGTGMVSPPTRGWTHDTKSCRRSEIGFPAHAGMDPHTPSGPHQSEGFPRPRGDGPAATGVTSANSTAVSPPTRGWTPPVVLHLRQNPGFPAHAGMDLSYVGRQDGAGRFPRPRGDGPMAKVARPWRDRVSPPTRGWTLIAIDRRCAARGFPAHAGMDPSKEAHRPGGDGFPRPRGDGPCNRPCRRYPADRFPRPRGDGPQSTLPALPGRPVSPPTRGWTVEGRNPVTGHIGFPAHAGMDPQAQCDDQTYYWFPRPRGDGPNPNRVAQRPQMVSPPTRGWTQEHAVDNQSVPGFPAHAGMDRNSTVVFPAHAGMDLAESVMSPASRVSPPTRGWTSVAVKPVAPVGGFPAHAGMDPASPAGTSAATGFPRPRGDGPSAQTHVQPGEAVSPPTRGWTVT